MLAVPSSLEEGTEFGMCLRFYLGDGFRISRLIMQACHQELRITMLKLDSTILEICIFLKLMLLDYCNRIYKPVTKKKVNFFNEGKKFM